MNKKKLKLILKEMKRVNKEKSGLLYIEIFLEKMLEAILEE